MRVLILSDSHGYMNCLKVILKKEAACETVFFLGDGGSDFFKMKEELGGRKLITVKGNCDAASYNFQIAAEETICGVHIFACHGHTFHVKTGLEELKTAALSRGASVALYGHTHTPAIDFSDGICFMNPGSVSDACYGTLELAPNAAPYPALHRL